MSYYKDKYGVLFNGDSLQILTQFPSEFIDMCITSPPYWALRDYHQESQLGQEPLMTDYVRRLTVYFEQVKRVLKQKGSLYVNLGDTFYGSSKGAGGPSDKQLSNKGSRYKLNKDNKESKLENSAIFKNNELPNKSLCLIPSRFAIEMQNIGWVLRGDIIWHKPNKFPESAKDRFTLDYEHLFFFTKISKGYYFEQQLEPAQKSSIKRSKSGWNGEVEKETAYSQYSKYQGSEQAQRQILKGRNKRSVWSINTKGVRGTNHFAKFPEELIESPIKASCPENGVVLDLFMGSGTTAIVAEKQNKKWIGIELNEDYCKTAIERILESRKET